MQFKVGDMVEYELSSFMTPRWFGNRDYNGADKWEGGKVVCLHHDKVEVLGRIAGLSIWPLPGHPEFRNDQWERPGYLKRKNNSPSHKLSIRNCVCGAHKTFGPECRLHSDWCDLYEK